MCQCTISRLTDVVNANARHSRLKAGNVLDSTKTDAPRIDVAPPESPVALVGIPSKALERTSGKRGRQDVAFRAIAAGRISDGYAAACRSRCLRLANLTSSFWCCLVQSGLQVTTCGHWTRRSAGIAPLQALHRTDPVAP